MRCEICRGTGYCADMPCPGCMGTGVGVAKKGNFKPRAVEYTIINNPTKRKKYAEATRFHAIDVQYNCPKCKAERVYTWPFPGQVSLFKDDCCDQWVEFIPWGQE